MTYEACVAYILSIPLFGKKDGHNNTRELLRRLGNPHDRLSYIHVAGTNGKGSVCAMLSYIYVEAGYQVGFFSSPHLVKINERIKINNVDITDEAFLQSFLSIKQQIDGMIKEGFGHPTFFETLFCISIVYFEAQKVNPVILETGLGGRLDATNIIQAPLVSIITQIGLDHMSILGDTIAKITQEKSGIIKNNCPTVLQSNQVEVKNVVTKACKRMHSKLYKVHPYRYEILERTDKSIDFSIQNKYYYYDRLVIHSNAIYQVENAATTLVAISVIREKLPLLDEAILGGMRKFFWPGRMEMVNNWLLLDGAHNASGMATFVQNIEENFPNRNITLLFAAMKDKAYEEMIKQLCRCPLIKRIVITCVHEERCLPLKTMKETFGKYTDLQIEIEANAERAFEKVYRVNDDLLCCVGSLYLVGEVKKIMMGGTQSD